jgi:CDP-glucose 4,6-dehydratase
VSALALAYAGKRVLVTGHSGFKGSWLTLWLRELGASVTGYSLAPDPRSLFTCAGLAARCTHVEGDVRDLNGLTATLERTRPDVIFHLAAQALVRRSYLDPLGTFETNALGTAHLLEAVRLTGTRCAVVIVSSDKCYENREWVHGYREDDALGGHDVYSMSKGVTELVTQSYRRSFFPPAQLARHGVALASARAGNVIGGGDWAAERLVPDVVAALHRGQVVPVRNPLAVRPWQHVLEPLNGYLHLGARLLEGDVTACEAFNFGPAPESARPVRELVEALLVEWGEGAWADRSDPGAPHEATWLNLSIDKARARLGWQPRWDFTTTVAQTVRWYRAQLDGASAPALEQLCLDQLAVFTGTTQTLPAAAA